MESMPRYLIVMLLTALSGLGQSIVDPSRFTPAMLDFEGEYHEAPLQCEVTPIHPALNYGFRFQAGYVTRIPMSQYLGKGHLLVTLMRVTPEGGGKPIYLGSRMRLPEIPPTKNEMELGGGFLLGQGRYEVAWHMWDDKNRVCRKHWKIDAHLGRGEKLVTVALPPGTVADFSLRGAPKSLLPPDDAAPVRLTILLHAAPLSPRRFRLGVRDRILLTGTLSSLLERMPVKSVRLVVFNLDQQKELYRDEHFERQSLTQVAQSISSVELGKVDFEVLKNRGGHVDLLADLINGELTAKEPSDVVLFLGPEARFSDKVPPDELEKVSGSAPRFFYLQYRPYLLQTATFPDIIVRTISKLKGRTMVIRTPGDFAKAIDQVERR